MMADDDPEHLDFVVLSAHKMYAPFGTGALIGPKEVFLADGPEYRGGGTVDVVTLDEVHWADLPDRDEAGSPNVVGAVAMAAAAQALMEIGMDNIAAHEEELVAYALKQLQTVPGICIFGECDPAAAGDKVGVIPFNLAGLSHFLLAAILGYEGGIGVRSGCYCAHPYVVHLLQLSPEESHQWRDQLLGGDRSNMPGMVRISFGCYNNFEDVDKLVVMLRRIAAGDYEGRYELNVATGEYRPAGYVEPFEEFFVLEKP
jgi:selenocysteine lyase/cysteine desulfurase